MKHFTTVNDIKDPNKLIELGIQLKKNPFKHQGLGKNKTLGLVFMNPSLRTRLSTVKAANNLGMETMVLNINNESWAIEWEDEVIMNGTKVEHIKEAAKVLGTYCDIIGFRSFPTLTDKKLDYSEKNIIQLMNYSGVPVVSLESATLHPLQSLADAITIKETWKKTSKPKVVLTWAPHLKPLPQAVPNSFSEWMCKMNVDFTIAHPEGYELAEDYTKGAKICHNQNEALMDADYVYVKNWSSYSAYGQMPGVKGNWLLDEEKYKLTNEAGIMHCLPVRRELELSGKLIDHKNSLIPNQIENRVYSAQAVLTSMLQHMGHSESVAELAEMKS
ncbi:MAG: acetylornithine carbamoyltransferase [Bacteroidia bacterium]